MIAGIFHKGSGLGNQLHRYVATRCLAKDKGYEFSMVAPENFKGSSFMNLDMGVPNHTPYQVEIPSGKLVPNHKLWEEKTNYYNPEFNFIEDNTIIDGEFQDERYFGHRLREIDDWLKVEPLDMPDEVCVVNFRGGEYALFPELFLPIRYWYDGLAKIQWTKYHTGIEHKDMKFEVHTDDKEGAKSFFIKDHFADVITGYHQDIALNWRSLRYAKHAVISNSSFAILPRLLKHMEDPEAITVAPRYWARRNTKEWSMPQNYYKSFKYI